MDMWEPYMRATRARVPGAAGEDASSTAFTSWAISARQRWTRCASRHRALMAAGDATLKGNKYLWLYSRENVPARRRAKIRCLAAQGLRSGAPGPSEALRRLWHYVYPTLRLEVLEAVVRLGDAQPTEADAQGGGDEFAGNIDNI